MKYTVLATVAALIAGTAATGHAVDAQSPYGATPAVGSGAASDAAASKVHLTASSEAALSTLLAEWNQAGFTPPSKPSQYRVYGRNGYATSGPRYNAMAALIRSAVADAEQGRDSDAATHIAKAMGLLAGAAPSTATFADR